MTQTFSFPGCVVVSTFETGYTETMYADGTCVPAVPQETAEYRQTAEQLGYGGDVAALSREHEVCHTLLSQWIGLSQSPTLWDVAHGTVTRWHIYWAEEDAVLNFQRMLNGWFSWLPPLWAERRRDALRMLRGWDAG